ANATKSGFLATKSVSELISTSAPTLPSMQVPMAPSAATRPAAFEAFAPLLMRSSSSAFFMSPPASSSAFLHSIMPSPVSSRSSFTIPAVISAICLFPWKKGALRPLFHVRGFVDSSLVGFLDFHEVFGALRDHLGDDLAAALEDRVGHAARVEADGARGVVVARDHVVDAVERVVRVDDADDRDAERARLGDRDLVEAHVDHEEGVGRAAHVLDAAQGTLELLALAREGELLLLGEALDRVVGHHLVH